MARVFLQTQDGVVFMDSAHTPDFIGNPNAAINPEVIPSCDIRFMKVVGGALQEMTPEEQAVVTAPEYNSIIKSQIDELEKKQLRATREYLLGDAAALARIQAIDSQISILRGQMK